MGYPPLEDLLPKSRYSVYKLIRMAATRATELADGKKKLVDVPQIAKTTTVALEEIKAGAVVLKEASDQLKPQEAPKPAEPQEAEQAE